MNSKIAYLLALLTLPSSLTQARPLPIATVASVVIVPHANSETNFYGVRSSMKINPVTGHPGIAHFDRTAGHLIYTESDGTDWTESVVDTFSTSSGRNPDHFYCSLAFDAAGKPNIAFFDRDQADLKFSRRNAAGTGWITEAVDEVIYYGDAGRFCSLGYAPDGKFYVSYYHYSVDYLDQNNPDDITVYTADLRVATRSVSGTWSIETVDSIGDVGQSCALDIAPTGYPAVSYLDTTNQDIKLAYFNGSTWSKSTLAKGQAYTAIDSRSLSSTQIEICVVFKNPTTGALIRGETTLSTSGNNNGTRGPFDWTPIESSVTVADPAFTYDRQGNAVVVYFDATSGDFRMSHVYQYSLSRTSSLELGPDPDNIWGFFTIALGLDGIPTVCLGHTSKGALVIFKPTGWSIDKISSVGPSGGFPSLQYGPGAQPAVCFHDSATDSIKYAERDFFGWWTVETIKSPVSGSQTSSLAFNPQSRPSLCYGDTTSEKVYFTERAVNGTWTSQVVEENGVRASTGDLCYGPTGQPSLAYNTLDDHQLKFAERSANGIWNIQVLNYKIANGCLHSMRYSPEGKPAICYQSELNGFLFMERQPDGTWTTRVISVNYFVTHASLSYGPTGNPSIALYHTSEGSVIPKIKFAERGNDGIWRLQSAGDAADHPVFGISHSHGASEKPAFGYQDYPQNNLKIAERRADGLWHTQVISDLSQTIGVGQGVSLRYSPEDRPSICFNAEPNEALMYAERYLSPALPDTAQPFQVKAITRDPTTKAATLSWQGTTAGKYDVEFSTSLAAGSWQPIGTDINALDGMTFFRTTPALGQANPRAFFRVKKK